MKKTSLTNKKRNGKKNETKEKSTKIALRIIKDN